MTKKCSSANPVNTTLKVMGGKWKPLILWLLDDQVWRFSDLQREMAGVTQKMLIQQLRELEEHGLVHREVYPVVPPKVEYSLTEYAKTLKPVLMAMAEWGEKHGQRGK